MSTVLFVCLQNAGRSQMSRRYSSRPPTANMTRSRRALPADHVHPEVVDVMRELDIDLSDRTPQLLTRELAEQADIVVTMGCGDQCPFIPGKRYIDWELPDPARRTARRVRATRDEIARRVSRLVDELDSSAS